MNYTAKHIYTLNKQVTKNKRQQKRKNASANRVLPPPTVSETFVGRHRSYIACLYNKTLGLDIEKLRKFARRK